MPYKRTRCTPIGPIVKEKRLAADMGLSECARKMGVAKSYLWNIEQGKIASPDFHVVMRLCEVLKISVWQLYRETKIDP